MDGVAGYILSVVVIPALLAGFLGGIALCTPLRRRAWAVELAVGCALAVAFLASFTNELGWNAVLRQVVAIEGDDAPFERWHRLGLAAALLPLVACLATAARAWLGKGGAWVADFALMALCALVSALFVEFPRANLASQLGLAGLLVAGFAAWRLAGGAILWISWGAFGIVAALAGLGGFASLAVMCGAVSVGALILAVVSAIGGRFVRDAAPLESAGAPLLSCAVMLALCARCGDAYDQSETPDWLWWLVPLVPGFALVFAKQAARAPSVAASSFWRTLGAAIAGIAILATAVALDARGAEDDAAGESDPYADMYGG
jgi:hypothetical protein